MEKAILKTLIYADIFDYPLTIFKIHKWLISKRSSLRQVEKALEKLKIKGKAVRLKGYYLLYGRNGLVRKRYLREKQSRKFLWKARVCAWFLKIIPWIKLIGISGGLAMENASSKDDIDLFIVTSKNRLWLTRILTIGILDFVGVRRKAKMTNNQVSGKFCVNILLEEDSLEQKNKDIYTAHEVLQMKVLWERGGIYYKYLLDNQWAFKFLPNWVGSRASSIKNQESRKEQKNYNSLFMLHDSFLNLLEYLAKKFQLLIMKQPKGMERITEGALYFHPNDVRPQIIESYRQRVKTLSTP